MKRLVSIWNQYWFQPAPLINLAIARVVGVSVQLLLFVIVRDKINDALNLARLPGVFFEPIFVLRLFTYFAGGSFRLTPELIQIGSWAIIVSGLLALVGFKTNFSLFFFTVGNLLINAFIYSFGEFHHTEGIMMIALFILSLSPCGRVVSLDALIAESGAGKQEKDRKKVSILAKKSVYAYWPVLLIKWMYGLVYLSAALAKISRGGLSWMNGYTIQFNMLDSGVRRVAPLGLWLGQQHELAILSSWVVILFESTFWLVALFPRLVWVYLPVGIGIHLGILLTMGPDFYEFLALYVILIPWLPVVASISKMNRPELPGCRGEARK